jgi:hypothetical protein
MESPMKCTLVVCLCLCISLYLYLSNDMLYIHSDIDNQKYVVLNMGDPQEGADTLANISKRLLQLKQYLQKHHPDDIITKNIESRFNTSNISEGSPDSSYTSYTVDKGEKMVFCIRDSDKRIHNMNLLMYVCIHELAHVGSVSKGHNGEFKKHFEFLLSIANKLKIYHPIPFGKKEISYCGTVI